MNANTKPTDGSVVRTTTLKTHLSPASSQMLARQTCSRQRLLGVTCATATPAATSQHVIHLPSTEKYEETEKQVSVVSEREYNSLFTTVIDEHACFFTSSPRLNKGLL